ncbi:MAG: hypothetical protein MJZ94_02210 [Bacteroidales bacterium]|nr:hypothetical protein [Bacteroidales bacterium]
MARNVIYCEKDGEFEFFGSPSALFERYGAEEIGCSVQYLNNTYSKLRKEGKPLEYKSPTGFIIRKGEIVLKVTETKSANHLGKKKAMAEQPNNL